MTVSPEFLALQERLAGRYFLEGEEGRRGATIRFRARDVVLERPVVIEFLRPGGEPEGAGAGQPLRDRFLEGARAAAGLFHPSIAPIHAVEADGPFAFVVRAHVDGETLEERVDRAGPLGPPAVRRLVEEVAWALAHAHGRGVTHGHLTPDDIVLEAGSGRAVLTGFGLADAVAPSRPGGTAADLRALGACGMFALTGTWPRGGSAASAKRAGSAERAGSPERRPPLDQDLPPELAGALEACLAPDRSPASAAGLASIVAQPGAMPSILPSSARRLLRRIRQFSPVAGLGTFVLWLMRESDLELVVTPIVALVLGWMAVGLVRSARQVLRDGFDLDLITWVLEEEARELAAHPDGSAHRIQNLAIGCGGVMFVIAAPIMALVAIGTLVTFIGGGTVSASLWADSSVAGILLVTFLFLAGPSEDRDSPRRWLDFGERMMVGRFGRLLFRAARLGLGRGAPRDRPVHGEPTVLALADSFDDLFAALPADVRARFAEAPEAVHRLTAYVRELERKEAALTLEGDAVPEVAGQVRSARVELERRRTEATAALEHLRLSLIRMGAGDPHDAELTGDLTLELARARSIDSDLGALLEARAELRELLAGESTHDPDA